MSDKQQTITLTDISTKNSTWQGKLQINLPPFPVYRLGQRLTVQCTPQSFAPAQRWRPVVTGSAGPVFQCHYYPYRQASQSVTVCDSARSKPLSSSLFIARSMNRKHHYCWDYPGYQNGMPVD